MSGIAGMVNLDGKPVENQVLQEMASFLSFRGPDAQDIWTTENVGFVHALLKTTRESEHERQPSSLDGQVWIAADARIDGQAELISQLQAKGRAVAAGLTDAELILHAYHAWEENCLHHLIGDFSFAIWDGRRQKLFCARDHFGVKPFFYARVGQTLAFSNTLECLHRHPLVSGKLNDLWIADFLLFERSLEPAATAFADIQRLPPGHSLTWSVEGLRVNGYWALPTDLGIRYRPAGDYVEHFTMLLEQAVADRLRTNRISVEMSGGMDSTAIAVIAKDLLARQNQPFELHAHTAVFDRLITDEERRFAGEAAEKIGIPIHYLAADGYKLFERCGEPDAHWPEPAHKPDTAQYQDFLKQVAACSRVVLTGWDGDALLSEAPSNYFRFLLRQREYGRLSLALARMLFTKPGQLARGVWRRLGSRGANSEGAAQPYPSWISPELEKRFELRQRWHEYYRAPAVSHPVRPFAYHSYEYMRNHPIFFDSQDAGLTRQPLEYRHPLLDLRLVEYCLSLPPYPWCDGKQILRAAMKGRLPESVRSRPKTTLAGFPYVERLQQAESRWVDSYAAEASLHDYVERARIPAVWSSREAIETWSNMRPLSLNYWLKDAKIR